MPGYGRTDTPHRLYLKEFDGSKEWVDIRRTRTLAQLQLLEACGISASATTVSVEAARNLAQVVMREFVLAWSLKADEKDAEPMPLTEHTFGEVLDDAAAVWLIQTILSYYDRKRLTEDVRGESNGRSSTPLAV